MHVRTAYGRHDVCRRRPPLLACNRMHMHGGSRHVSEGPASSYGWGQGKGQGQWSGSGSGPVVKVGIKGRARGQGWRPLPLTLTLTLTLTPSPRELGTILGLPVESKKALRRLHSPTSLRGGTPSTSMMHASCSTSFSPGKRG